MIVLADQPSRFHVHVERFNEPIQCHFLVLNIEQGTATVEPYNMIYG
jgi:hypothetical protein